MEKGSALMDDINEKRLDIRREGHGRRDYDSFTISDHDLLLGIHHRTCNIEEIMKSVVTQVEFKPVKLVVFGLVGIIVTSVMGALVFLVLGGAGP